jgi:uncharacterized protein with ParB-like and HNH nuclease domain
MEVEILLKDIGNKDLVLPEFQRDFVWKADDIKKYIQSTYEIVKPNSIISTRISENFESFINY